MGPGPLTTAPPGPGWTVLGVVRAVSASLEGSPRDEEVVLAYRALGAAAALCPAGDPGLAQSIEGLRARAIAIAGDRGLDVLDLVAA